MTSHSDVDIDAFMSATNSGRDRMLRLAKSAQEQPHRTRFMAAKTTAQRVTETKQRKRDAGMIEIRSLWVYPEDVPAIREAAAKLQAKRLRVNPNTQAPKIDRR